MAQNISNMLSGVTIRKKSVDDTVTIHWKQGSCVGFGGDRSQTYARCRYEGSLGGNTAQFLVFIQESFTKSESFRIDHKWQYGVNDGVMFLVYHDKSQTPYQNRFVTNKYQQIAKGANEALKLAIQSKTGVAWDAQWMVGDYLHDCK